LKQLLGIIALVFFAPLMACAQDGGSAFVEGEHYDLVTPVQRTRDPAKIEVVEFFWYGCSHCYNFEPMVTQWQKNQSEDVDFVPSPAAWNKAMEIHAQAFYAAQALGVADTVHPALFAAMNVDRKRLANEDEIEQLFVANGVAAADFSKAFSSFGVTSQVRQAGARARGAQITGTPEMMVAGKYRISTRKAGSQANMLKIADFLVEKERAAR
jgi:thiol:disulfide interchange protein DsbA